MWEKIGAVVLPLLALLLDFFMERAGKDDLASWAETEKGKGALRALALIERARRVRAEAADSGRPDPYIRP